ncbi:MAG: FtsB family cell division protein [Candidatus Saccharimonadales bacterium]
MFAKIKHGFYKTKQAVLQLRDVRVVGLLLFLLVVLMVSWSGVKTIETNYQLQREIAHLKQQNDLQALINENQRLENKYFETNQYLELAAREGFGLAAPGETVVIVPRGVALANTVELPKAAAKPESAEDNRPVYQRNFQAWMDFLFHRNAPEN